MMTAPISWRKAADRGQHRMNDTTTTAVNYLKYLVALCITIIEQVRLL
jgi:hypothetical protein